MEWKSVEKGWLPDDGELVLCWSDPSSAMVVGVYYAYGGDEAHSQFLSIPEGKVMLVTHWMPLPAPPQEYDYESIDGATSGSRFLVDQDTDRIVGDKDPERTWYSELKGGRC